MSEWAVALERRNGREWKPELEVYPEVYPTEHQARGFFEFALLADVPWIQNLRLLRREATPWEEVATLKGEGD